MAVHCSCISPVNKSFSAVAMFKTYGGFSCVCCIHTCVCFPQVGPRVPSAESGPKQSFHSLLKACQECFILSIILHYFGLIQTENEIRKIIV